MHKVLVNRLGGLGLPRKTVVRLTDHPNMTLDVYRGRKTTTNLSIYPSIQMIMVMYLYYLVRCLAWKFLKTDFVENCKNFKIKA